MLPSHPTGLWRNGSASDSRSEGWEFESLWPHLYISWAFVLKHIERVTRDQRDAQFCWTLWRTDERHEDATILKLSAGPAPKEV